MNIGIIGGSGFIGSHLVDKLLEHDHEVTVLDIKKPHRDDITHIHIDITNLSKTTLALIGNYDIVYLLAAMADVNDVYQIMCTQPQNWGAELYCHAYQKLYAQDFTILRYGIPYGPRARAGTVIAAFVRKALNHEPLTILGDGSQYRNFVYVEDLALGNVAALEATAANQTYNLEGSKPITIKEVAETVQKLVGNVEIEYQDARAGDYQGKLVSIEKAKRELNWEPRVSLEEGITRYIEWYKENVPKS